MPGIKDSDNTSIEEINTITNPNTKSLIDRYVFASNFCKGKDVLDCACGYGYGGIILYALGANSVDGFDIDEKAIKYCDNKFNWYEEYSNKPYNVVDVTKNWEEAYNVFQSKRSDSYKTEEERDIYERHAIRESFYDVVVSIETFEHVPRETVPQMLKNFKRVCKPGGTIIITTPCRREPEFVYRGGTHLYEYNVNEFIEELSREFTDIQLFAGVEFRAYSPELQTSFSNNPDDLEKCAIMVAVIKNE